MTIHSGDDNTPDPLPRPKFLEELTVDGYRLGVSDLTDLVFAAWGTWDTIQGPQSMFIPGRWWQISSRNIRKLPTVTRPSSIMASSTLKLPIHLVLDFDGTLTARDTLDVLGRLPKVPQMTWQEISEAYTRDYKIYKDEGFHWSNRNRGEYSHWLASRKWVEVASAQRVQDAGFFKGVTLKEVDHVVSTALESGDLQLKENWAELISLGSMDINSDVSIISVNWSETFIRMTLMQAAQKLNRTDLVQFIKQMKIHANEIDNLSAPKGSSGQVCRSNGQDIRTSDDKLRHLPRVDEGLVFRSVIYVGDSPTDFDCLCAADLGVWLYDVPESDYPTKFREIFEPLDFVPPPISSFKDTKEPGVLFYWARNLGDVIEALVLG